MSYKHIGPRTRKGWGWLLGLLIFLLVLILACGGIFLWARDRVGVSDRVMPGVRLYGADIAGCDRDQVVEILREKGYAPLAGKNLTLSLPGEELRVPAEELGLVPDLEAEAEAILAWGHTGDRNRDALSLLLDRNRTVDFPRRRSWKRSLPGPSFFRMRRPFRSPWGQTAPAWTGKPFWRS